MSRFVDERVVEMSFDNKKFESNVKTSMGTISELKNSLDFSGTANKINSELNGVNVNGLSEAFASAKLSFSAFEVGAIAAIANITNRIVDMGLAFVQSMTTDQISGGFSMYSESAISEATLLAQGQSQEDVTKAIKEIMAYTDETSFSFESMMASVTKMVANGVNLDEAVSSVVGFSNWAATEGKGAEEAARVLIQLDQAIASGFVRKEDWKSIVTSTMGSEEFKKEALAFAVEMGQLTQTADGVYTTMNGMSFEEGQFAETLTEGLWFTTDVLMKTLDNYAGGWNDLYEVIENNDGVDTTAQALEIIGDEMDAQQKKWFLAAQEARTFGQAIQAVKDAVKSGWFNIFQNLFGAVAEAKVLWTGLANSLYDVFMDPMWKKIEVLEEWAEMGGRSDLFERTEETQGAFWNLFDAVVALKDLISGAWQKVFGFSELEDYGENVTDIATKLKTLTENLKEWTSKLFLSDTATEQLTNILSGLFSILKIIQKVIVAVVKGFAPLLGIFDGLTGKFNILGVFSDAGAEVTAFAKSTEFFTKITDNIQKFIKTIIEFIQSLELVEGVTALIDAFKESLSDVIGETDVSGESSSVFTKVIGALSSALTWLGNLIKNNLLPVLVKIGSVFGWLVGQAINLVKKIGELTTEFKEWFNNNEKIQNGLTRLKTVLSTIGSTFKEAHVNVKNFFNSFGKETTDDIEDAPSRIEKVLTPLQVFIKGLGDLFGGLWSVIKLIVPVVGQLFTFIGTGLSTIGNRLKEIFTKGDGEVNFAKLFTVGFWAAVAVGIIRFADFLRSITQVFRDAMDSMFSYMNSKAMEQYMNMIKTMAISILLMVGALLILGTMDPSTLKKSLAAMAVLIGFIVGTIMLMKQLVEGTSEIKKGGLFGRGKKIYETTKNLAGLAAAFLGLGVALLLMTISLKIVSNMDPALLMQGLLTIGLLMAMIVIVMKQVGESERGVNKAVKSMVKVAVSIALLARPLKKIGSIDIATGIQGLIGIGLLMGILVAYSRFSKTMDKDQKAVVSMTGFAVAITILLIPLMIIGNMPITKIAIALLAIAAIFGMLVVINKVLEKKLTKPRMENMTRMMQSLKPMAIGMLLMSIALLAIGNIPLDKIIKALGTMTFIFAMIVAINEDSEKKLTKPRMENMRRMMWTLIPMALGLVAFGVAIAAIGSIPWKTILIGLGTIVLILGIMIGVNKLLSMTGGSMSMVTLGISMVLLSYGFLALSVALLALGSLKLETIGKGLLAIVAMFVVLGVAGYLLAPVLPILLGLALTFIAFAAAIFVLSVAITAFVSVITMSAVVFAAGLIAMATAVVVAAPLIMKALWVIIKGILGVIAKSIPLVVENLVIFISEIIKGIVTLAPQIIGALVGIIEQLLVAIVTLFPQVINTIVTLLLTLFDVLIINVPTYVTKLLDFYLAIVRTLRGRLPEIMTEMGLFIGEFIDASVAAIILLYPRLVNAGFDLIIGLMDGIGNAIVERAPELREHIKLFCENIWKAILSFFGINSPSTKMMEVAGDLIAGLVKGLWDGLKGLFTTIKNWTGDVITKIGSGFSGAVSKGKDLINNIKAGAKTAWEGTSGVRSWIAGKATDLSNLFTGTVSDMKTAGSNLINGLAAGMSTTGASIKETVEKVAGDVTSWFKNVFGIKSPSRVFAEMGMYLDLGLAKGIEDNTDSAYNAAQTLGDDTAEGMEKSGLSKVLSDLNSSLESDFDNEIVIRPVFDLSEIQNGKNQLYSMMKEFDGYDVSGSNSIAGSTRDGINKSSRFNDISKNGSQQGNPATSEVINNTFNITGANAKEIADEVSRVLQIQVDRRKAQWAL